jgi:hypothetical protein
MTHPLTIAEVAYIAPSVNTGVAAPSRSDKFRVVRTAEVLERLGAEGFEPYSARQQRKRSADGHLYAKHELRLRHASLGKTDGGFVEVILRNAHDGTSAYNISLGFHELVCKNGLRVGKTMAALRVNHSGNMLDRVIDASYEVVSQTSRIADKRAEMLATPIGTIDAHALAWEAMALRYGPNSENHWPFAYAELLTPRHYDQRENNLWNVFNRIQENVIRGGIPGTSIRGRRSRSGEVRALDAERKLNVALWDAAESYLQAA